MSKKTRTRARRDRGVQVIEINRHDGTTAWVARWTDPATQRTKQATFRGLGITTAEARKAWAKRKAEELLQESIALRSEGPAEVVGLVEAIEDYLARAGQRLRPVTVSSYRQSLQLVVAWSEGSGRRVLAELRPADLSGIRDAVIRREGTRGAKGKGRGARKATGSPRRPATINGDLRRIRVFLNEARRLGRTPYLSRDAILDRLPGVSGAGERPEPLTRTEIRALLSAARRHDDAGHPPIEAFLRFVLLSGCRLREARELHARSVRLPQREILLRASETKTKQPRAIDLEVSPSLVELIGRRLVRGRPGYLFGTEDSPLSADAVKAARKRLLDSFGAPDFTWQRLRQTCASYLTCSPGIYGAASAYLSAKRCGHSVVIAERHYAGILRGISPEARTLEAAMGLDAVDEAPARAKAAR